MLKSIKSFIPYLLLLVIVIGAVASLDVFINLNIRTIIDQITTGTITDSTETIIKIAILLVLYFPSLFIFNYLRSKFIQKSMTKMKINYIKRVFNKNINEFQKDNNSMYLSSLTNDYNQIESNFIEPIIDLLYSLVNFAAGVVLFTIVNPIILAIVIGLMIVNIIISTISAKPLNRHNKERADLFGGYTSYIKEVLSAFHIIKNNNLEDKVRQDYRNKSQVIQYKGFIIDRIRTIFFAIQNSSFSLTFIGLIIVVGLMSITRGLSFGSVVLVIMSADKVVWPINHFAETLPKLFSVKSLFTRINETLKNKNEYYETVDFEGFKHTLQLNNMTFGYEDGNVLENINIEFKKGEKYLIIGPSGGGKSTVLKLLRKYFNPTSGDILIDNVPLKDIKKEQYFSHIANIEQNVFLFEDTVRNNLTLYKTYTDEEINSAIARSGLIDFISGLPEGLDTMIYDNGKNISGGERSRIAIARGLLNHADIIFLDEAFASLDMKKAKEIEESILGLKDVTVINVSHVVFKEHQDMYDKVFVIKNKTATVL